MQKIAIDSKQKYYYYHRLDSINTETFSAKQFEFIEAWVINENKLRGRGKKIEEAAHQRVCFANFLVLDKIVTAKATNLPETKKIVHYLRNNFLFIMRNRIFTKSRKLSMLLLLFSIHLYKFPVELRRKKLANNK